MPPRKAIIQLDDGWAKLQGSIDQLIEVCENDFPPKTDMSQAMANYSCALPLLLRVLFGPPRRARFFSAAG